MNRLFFTLMLAGACIVSCDTAHEDSAPQQISLDVYAAPQSPAIIRPSRLLGASSTSFEIAGRPSRGSVERIGERNFLRYTPNEDFLSGDDRYSLQLLDTDGNEHGAIVNVRMLEPGSCTTNGVFEYIPVKRGESISLDLLDNEFFCGLGFNLTSAAVSVEMIYTDPDFGDNDVNIALALDRNEVVLEYTAPEDASGKVEFIYELGVNSDNANSDVFLDGTSDPSLFEKFVVAQVTVEIVE